MTRPKVSWTEFLARSEGTPRPVRMGAGGAAPSLTFEAFEAFAELLEPSMRV